MLPDQYTYKPFWSAKCTIRYWPLGINNSGRVWYGNFPAARFATIPFVQSNWSIHFCKWADFEIWTRYFRWKSHSNKQQLIHLFHFLRCYFAHFCSIHVQKVSILSRQRFSSAWLSHAIFLYYYRYCMSNFDNDGDSTARYHHVRTSDPDEYHFSKSSHSMGSGRIQTTSLGTRYF